MQNVYPPDRVLVSKNIPMHFQISPADVYVDIYTSAEREAIIDKYRKPNLFNGTCIRLDAIQDNTAWLSPVCFYDFLCCNIVGIHNKDPLAINKLNLHLAKYGKIDSFEKLLQVRELPNIIGTSTLLHDINNEYLLVERNTSVSVGSGMFAATSSGSLDETDISIANPILGCGHRELQEELNIRCDLYIEGIIAPIQKMQPIALLTGCINQSWRQVLPIMLRAEDYAKENKNVLIVPKDKLMQLISLYAFTDAAAYQIFFECGGDAKAWKKCANGFVNVKEFYYKL